MTATDQELLRRASRLREEGRVEEAIDAYRLYLERRPDSATSWFNLAWLERRARRFEEALESYARARALGIDGPEEVHLNRAAILADDLAEPERAEAELRRALALAPAYVPALLNLGNFHEDRGERAEARAAYARAVEADPGNALALARLAGVTPVEGGADAMSALLRRALARPGQSPGERADLGFALGQRLDSAGAYEEAFSAFEAANAAARAGAPPYDPAAAEALVDRLIGAFPAPRAASGGSEEAPLFICGMFRSGSTLAEQILAGHSRIAAGGELDLVPALVAARGPSYPEAAADAGWIAEARAAYLAGIRGRRPGDALLTDKRPDNFLHIGLIKAMFPDAKIVHTRRDPLDNCLSVYFLHLDPAMSYALDLASAGHWYRQQERLMAHWKSLYPDDIFELDYDALVAAPRETVEPLLAFLGLGWEEGCLAFHQAPAVVRTASVWQVRQPLYRRSSGRWRNYERHLGPLRRALGEP